LRAPAESSDVGGANPAVGVGKPAAFHLDLDPAAKVRVAQRNFMKIASDEAVRLGEWKDDIALLCDDPGVVAWIAAEWHIRKEGADRVTLSAFADIFERVKHPEFLEATKELFRIDDAFVAGKAIQSAITQADPSLLDEIRHAYDVAKTTAGPETTPFRVQCILAARACGGPGLSAFLGEVLTENNLVLRIEALQVARDVPTVGIEPVLRSLTGTQSASASTRGLGVGEGGVDHRRSGFGGSRGSQRPWDGARSRFRHRDSSSRSRDAGARGRPR